ncbi:unnamed protein product [Linum trigynum]|uniref:Thymidine kinase n=1 Tax=Linum trigynum TaxID=586398 RepID=A0AAV2C8B1_9ROSI
MFAVSRMKALFPLQISLPVAPAFPNAAAFFSAAPKSTLFFNFPAVIQFPASPSLRPIMGSSGPAYSRVQNRNFRLAGAAGDSTASYPSGEIHVIVGPMFAGKTTSLLRRIQSESENGRSVAVVKSDKDTRYGLESIVTHDGLKLPCWSLPKLSIFRQSLGVDAYNQLDVIGIDEAQFFGDLYDFCREAADQDGKTVIVAGLDGDYRRRSFGAVLDIIPLADSVTKLTARCELCGKRAFFTLRKTDETKVELIAGADVYMPVCRQHYVSGQAVVEATRAVVEESSERVQIG